MKRILIVGSNGAGKSTFSYRLAELTALPLVHLDKLYWSDNWAVTPREVFLDSLRKEAEKPAWIIEGNNLSSLPERLKLADTVFWFEFPPVRCVWNILCREIRYFGRARPDMQDGCKSRIDPKFLKIVWNYNRKNRGRILACLQASNHAQIIHFTNYKQIRTYLEGLSSELSRH